jgi:hypothetical protein
MRRTGDSVLGRSLPHLREALFFIFILGVSPEVSCTVLIGSDPSFQPSQLILLFSAEGVDIIYQWHEDGISWSWFPDSLILGISDFMIDMLPYTGIFRYCAAAAA